jgi:chromosome segregation ATPase
MSKTKKQLEETIITLSLKLQEVEQDYRKSVNYNAELHKEIKELKENLRIQVEKRDYFSAKLDKEREKWTKLDDDDVNWDHFNREDLIAANKHLRKRIENFHINSAQGVVVSNHQILSLEKKIQNQKNKNDRLVKENKQLKEVAAVFKKGNDEINHDRFALEKKIQNQKKTINNLQSSNTKLRNKVDDLRVKCSQLEKDAKNKRLAEKVMDFAEAVTEARNVPNGFLLIEELEELKRELEATRQALKEMELKWLRVSLENGILKTKCKNCPFNHCKHENIPDGERVRKVECDYFGNGFPLNEIDMPRIKVKCPDCGLLVLKER